jgi:ferrous iron transport protein B
VFALPAGVAIWLVGNVTIAGQSLAQHLVGWLNPVGVLIGLNGVVLLAYVVAIPANEIVAPTILMLTVATTGITGVGEQGAGVMFEAEGSALMRLFQAGGWTTLTGVCLMLFSLCHNPCSTTIYTIWKETKSAKWTCLATFLPIVFGIVICGVVALVWRLFS